MAFTGRLGSPYSKLGSILLGAPDTGVTAPPNFDPEVIQDLVLTQTATTTNTINRSVTSTLTLSQIAQKPPPLPAIVGYSGGQTRYAFVMDTAGDYPLYELNPDVVFDYPASVTKVMTALLLMEYKGGVLDSDTVTVTTADTTILSGASVAGLMNNDVLTWRELLYAIIVPSGGDACQCAARIIGTEIYVAAGSTGNTGMTRFIERMNDRAAELDMTGAVYWDSWGYSRDGSNIRNQMTARSLAKLMAEAVTHADLNTVFGTASHDIVITGTNARTIPSETVNHFVNGPRASPAGIKDANIIGGKVGEWNLDGSHLNLVNAWTAPNGNIIVIVTMNSENYHTMQLDQQGLIYSLLRDWPYLLGTSTVATDPYLANVKLLVGGNNGTIVDESSFGHTVTNTSVTTTTRTVIAETTTALEFNAASDGLTFADAVALTIGSNDATIEVWYQAPVGGITSTSEKIWFGKFFTGQREWTLNWDSNNLTLSISPDGTNWTTSTIQGLAPPTQHHTFFNGAPRHIAIVKSGSDIYGFINGEVGGYVNLGTIPDGTAPVSLGYDNADVSAVGQYADFRITIGAARYTAEKVTLEARAFPRASFPTTGASNSLVMTQTLARSVTYERTVEHTVSFTQQAYRTLVEIVPTQTVPLTQNAAAEKSKNVSASNTLVPTQTPLSELTINRSINQGLPITHSATRNIRKAVAPSNTLVPTQLAVGIVTHPTHNDLSLSQLAEALTSKGARHTIEIGQSVIGAVTYKRNAADNYIPFQVLSVNTTIRRTVPQTLSLAQLAVGVVVRAAHNTLTMTQLAVADKVKPATSQLVLFDISGFTRSFGVPVDQPLLLIQEIQLSKGKSLTVNQPIGFNQFARGTRRLTTTANNTLSLIQHLVREYKDRTVPQELNLDDTLTVSKLAPRSATNLLPVVQTVAVGKTIVRSIQQTITFFNSFEKYVGINGHETVTVPAVQVVKVKKVVVLQSDTLVIVLPTPEFNDSEGGTGRINIKRTMDGDRRIYTRDNLTSKLNYQFIIDRKKAIELRNFIMNSNTKFLTMINWKGEIWAVQMTNSPFSFGEDAAWLGSPGGNKSSITLEFEGVRLN